MAMIRRSPTFAARPRRGLAVVELAVCLPVIVLIVMASIEACSMIFLQQTLSTTAYETARFASAPRAHAADAIARGQQVLDDRDVNAASIAVDSRQVSISGTPTTVVDVTVTAPFDANRLMPAFLFGNQVLTAELTMVQE
jgi:hypothetical protein